MSYDTLRGRLFKQDYHDILFLYIVQHFNECLYCFCLSVFTALLADPVYMKNPNVHTTVPADFLAPLYKQTLYITGLSDADVLFSIQKDIENCEMILWNESNLISACYNLLCNTHYSQLFA